ncbi:hypothetical protein MJG53_013424 [Ovis ammon polii x Ovis aries]|uniref:Uncharacterized protein n=1 Tax=Ovis ammon polii x Ovis aries TaxID=2918886 RepID=A0ACB9UIT7_9CETA|nr:hypothetical protein MJG53_013424 [Ovis ammon polii x Ovis aries]
MQGPVHCDNHVQHSQGLRRARKPRPYPWTTSFREASLRSQPDTQPGLSTSGLGVCTFGDLDGEELPGAPLFHKPRVSTARLSQFGQG